MNPFDIFDHLIFFYVNFPSWIWKRKVLGPSKTNIWLKVWILRCIFSYSRMYAKMDQIDRHVRQASRRGGGGGASDEALTTLAKESFDILTLLPTYIQSTKEAVTELSSETKVCLLLSLFNFWIVLRIFYESILVFSILISDIGNHKNFFFMEIQFY